MLIFAVDKEKAMEVSELNTSIGGEENEDDYLKAANKQKKIARGENPT